MRIVWLLAAWYCSGLSAQNQDSISSFKINSAILHEERQFTVYVPSRPSGKMEVMYVLDGQALFNDVVASIVSIRRTNVMVVGIGNIWLRDRDYTPTHVLSSPFMDARSTAISGGGVDFIRHLDHELIAYVNEHFPVSGENTLIGHSLGGLIAARALAANDPHFRKYMLIDPAMWWDDARLLNDFKSLAPSRERTTVFLGIANTRNKDKKDLASIRNDTAIATAQIRPSIVLMDELENNKRISIQSKYYPQEDHMSVFRTALKDGLAFLLK